MGYLYIVATKEVLVTVRIAPEVRDQFKRAAELRGSTMSGLMHQFIVRTIREEREIEPRAFKRVPDKAHKEEPDFQKGVRVGATGEKMPLGNAQPAQQLKRKTR